MSEQLNQPHETRIEPPQQAPPPGAEPEAAAPGPEPTTPSEEPKQLQGRPSLQVTGPTAEGDQAQESAEAASQEAAPGEPAPAAPTPGAADEALPAGTDPAAEAPPDEPEPQPAVGETPAGEAGPEKPASPQKPEEVEQEAEATEEEPKSENLDWYILKVQSNREDSIREGLLRRVKIAGLERYFGDVIVPTETVTEFKGGKKRVSKRKLYPGYLVVHMEINDDTWFLVRETPGIGDFTGAAGRPSPMLPHEVDRILARTHEEKDEKAPKLKIGFRPGDQVKINEGTFENFEGEVDSIDETNGRVTVMINIFGRSTPVELEYWQIESV